MLHKKIVKTDDLNSARNTRYDVYVGDLFLGSVFATKVAVVYCGGKTNLYLTRGRGVLCAVFEDAELVE